jgi:hypothetical protein
LQNTYSLIGARSAYSYGVPGQLSVSAR